jgi:3-oxoacyl-[acyl-carrier protein] reductase
MDLHLDKRKALVMGGSRGIGKGIAEALIREGAVTAICARDREALDRTAAALGAHPFQADLSEPGAAERTVQTVTGALGGLDILVANTGGPPSRNFTHSTDADWRSAFELLWMSTVGAIRSALPAMRDQSWGRVVVITSVAAREPIPFLMLSNALRAGLHGLVNALSKECARDGLTVNAIMPGYTRTERLAALGLNEAELAAKIPAGRLGRVDELAALAAFLCSDRAGYITGQAFACDGGLLNSI